MIFTGYTENNDGNVFPLPWNPFYKSAWQTFLTAFAARYGSNPAFVSIAVAGPTAASAEIILPSDDDANNPQTQFTGPNISPNDMWLALLAFHYPGMAAYQGTDQAFIDAWDAAIDMYGEVFSGVTLVVTLDDKMPTFNTNTYTIPPLFSGDCSVQKATCATVTSILSYFVEPTVGGANAKATQTSSFIASKPNIDLGINTVKSLAQRTAELPAPSAQILAGIQVDKSFANPQTPDSVVIVRMHRRVSARRHRHARRVHPPALLHRLYVRSGRVHPAGLPRARRYYASAGELRDLPQCPYRGLALAGAGLLQPAEYLLRRIAGRLLLRRNPRDRASQLPATLLPRHPIRGSECECTGTGDGDQRRHRLHDGAGSAQPGEPEAPGDR